MYKEYLFSGILNSYSGQNKIKANEKIDKQNKNFFR
jgi:hypothetical protein